MTSERRKRRPVAAVILAALCAWCLGVVDAAAQDLPLVLSAFGATSDDAIVVLPNGKLFSFRDGEDQILVFLDGVTVTQGPQVLQGDTLVVVLARDEVRAAPAAPPEGGVSRDEPLPPAAAPERGVFMEGSRIREMFLTGFVTLSEKGVRTLEASSIYVDNVGGESVVLEGRMRTFEDGHPLVMRFEKLIAYPDESALLETVDYSTCTTNDSALHMTTSDAKLTPTPQGRILETGGNTFAVGAVPVFWWPGLTMNVDDNEGFLLRDVQWGNSGRFGTELQVILGGNADGLVNGVAQMLGSDEKLQGDWETRIAGYSDRGLFVEPTVTWEGKNTQGRFLASFINDSAETDELDQPIDDNKRGRFDLETRTYFERNAFDDFRVLDIDVSYLSDRNYLFEYYEREARIGREQDNYLWYRDIDGNEANTFLLRPRLNDYETQVEYLPEVQRRLLAEQTEEEWLQGAYLTVTDTFSHARLQPDEELDTLDSQRTMRIGRRARLDWAIDTGEGERLRASTGVDATWLSSTMDLGSEVRTSFFTGVEYQQTWVGVNPTYRSETWNLDGIRQILEPRVGVQTRFGTFPEPNELEVIDDIEQLNDNHRVFVGLRHRIQTHQNGRVRTILDSDIVAPFFPNEDRDNAGEVEGDVFVDLRYRPGANIWGLRAATLRYRGVLDPNDRGYEQSFLSYTTRIDDQRRFFVANNKAEHTFDFLTVGVLWDLTDKWTSALFYQRDRRLDETARAGVILRRMGTCWILDYVIETERGRGITTNNDRDDTQFRISLRPTAFQRQRPGDDDLLDVISTRIR